MAGTVGHQVAKTVSRRTRQASETLAAAVNEQVKACRRLVALGTRKQEALVQLDLAAIERILPEEREALAQLSAAEAAGTRAGADLAEAVDMAMAPASDLRDWAAALDAPQRLLLDGQIDQLEAVVAQLAAVSECNAQLIRRAQSYIDFRLAQTGRAKGRTEGTPAYDGRGMVSAANLQPSVTRHY
jgi:hypothetical protein